jgi:hypothetical protein
MMCAIDLWRLSLDNNRFEAFIQKDIVSVESL